MGDKSTWEISQHGRGTCTATTKMVMPVIMKPSISDLRASARSHVGYLCQQDKMSVVRDALTLWPNDHAEACSTLSRGGGFPLILDCRSGPFY